MQPNYLPISPIYSSNSVNFPLLVAAIQNNNKLNSHNTGGNVGISSNNNSNHDNDIMSLGLMNNVNNNISMNKSPDTDPDNESDTDLHSRYKQETQSLLD